MEVSQLKATARPRAGKGAARQARRDGHVPAVIYGDGKTPETISIDKHQLELMMKKGRFTQKIVELDVAGTKHRVLPRDVQRDPVRDFAIHVDFQRVTAKSRIRINVPVKFINELASPGLKRGGVLNIVRHDVEVLCPPDMIPAEFLFDLTGLEIGRSIHISSTTMPEGVTPTIVNRDFTVATIAGKKAEAEVVATPGDPAAAAAPAADAKAAPAAAGKAAPAGAKAPAGGKAAPAAKAPAAKPAGKK